MPITPLPPLDWTSPTFKSEVDTFFGSQVPTFCTEANALELNVNAKEASSVAAASTSTQAKLDAQASATAAASSASAAKWVAGTNYTAGTAAWSPINFFTYRARANGVSNVDPSLDAAGWEQLNGIAGISLVGSTVTDNYTIATTTPTIWPCATTARGKSITAPAVSSSTLLGLFAVIDNKAGGYSVGFRDSTEALIAAVAPGGVAEAYLEANGTAAGTWRVTGTNLEPGLITIDSTLSSTYASTVLAPFVALDNNTSIHFAALSSGFAAFVVDNAGKVLTTPVTVDATANSIPMTVFKISATQVMLFYGAGAAKAVVLTLSGASPSLSLSVGTPTANLTVLDNFIGAPSVAQLSPTLYVSTYPSSTTTVAVVALSVSGSTITLGAAATVTISATSGVVPQCYATSPTTALIIYSNGTALTGVVASVSGTVVSFGTAVAASSAINLSSLPVSTCQLATGKFLVLADPTTSVVCHACTVSGTTVTWGAGLTVESGGSLTAGSTIGYTASSATRYNPHLFPLSANTALLWYLDSGGISRAVVLTESGGTVTAGAILSRSISAAASGSDSAGIILPMGASEFLALAQEGGATAKYKVIPNKISGATISTGAIGNCSEVSSVVAVANGRAARLASGDYVVASSAVQQSLPVFRSNGDSVLKRGSVSLPAMAALAWPLAPVSSNRVVLLGQCAMTTTALSQLRLINMEIAA